MKTLFRCVLASLVVCLPLSAASVKKPQAIKGWGEVVDPDGDCRVAEDKTELTITVPKTHHNLTHTSTYTKLNSPRVLRPVEGDFTLEVIVPTFPLPGDAASSGSPYSFVSTGLLVWQDENNFIRVERAAVGSPNGDNSLFVWIERFKDGKPVSQQQKPLTDKDTGLRVVRKGNQFTFSCNEGGEGKDWSEVYTEEVELPGKLQVGVTAVNTTVREFPARLRGLELSAKK